MGGHHAASPIARKGDFLTEQQYSLEAAIKWGIGHVPKPWLNQECQQCGFMQYITVF
jgi:hypothetical protein